MRNKNAGLRSDGELVQARADDFDFRPNTEDRRADGGGSGHDAWIDLLSVGPAATRGDADDDDGLPDTIIWCLDGDGNGTSGREEILVTFDIADRTWSVNGEEVDHSGLSSLLFL